MDKIKDVIEGIISSFTDKREMEMSVIWLEKSILTGEGNRTYRIAEGTTITVENGTIIDTLTKATHKVIGCFGTINSSSLSFILLDLNTLQPEILKIK